MIGNTIEFLYYAHDEYGFEFVLSRPELRDKKPDTLTGLVVDAFTNISGSVTGRSESMFGFGSGHTSGSTKSNRKYKVEFYAKWDTEKKNVKYHDIDAWKLVRIVKYANAREQEKHEEKIIDNR